MDEQYNSGIPNKTRRDLRRCVIFGATALMLFNWPGSSAQADPKPARAKSVIQIWLWGGLSQLDTFDPKPEAGHDYCGPLNKTIATNVPGIRIGQKLPLLAQQADKYSVIRSMTHGISSHETAAYAVQTGHMPDDGPVYPSVGAVVSLYKGYDAGYTGMLPPYITITESQGRFPESGFLGWRYSPFCTGGDPNKTPFLVEGIVAAGISAQRQNERRALLHNLDTLGRKMSDNPQFKKMDEYENKAYELILGDEGKVFDLSTEDSDLRDKYGRNTFGQSCLLARRLVERGVPFITINYKGWDTHKQHFQTMNKMLPELDNGLAALLQDLSDRGLLDTTIVWCGGEFGHTPKIDWEAPWNGGRGHWGDVFSIIVAGGGFQGGRVVGASNEKGMAVKERPVYPWDLTGSIYELMGIDPDGFLPHPEGLKLRLTPGPGEAKSGGRLKEIMK
ncbi:MAG: DUF1501 domain-containing protein [Candidatus Ratteibacteria bacterium]|jgi:hypothetical protein